MHLYLRAIIIELGSQLPIIGKEFILQLPRHADLLLYPCIGNGQNSLALVKITCDSQDRTAISQCHVCDGDLLSILILDCEPLLEFFLSNSSQGREGCFDFCLFCLLCSFQHYLVNIVRIVIDFWILIMNKDLCMMF